VFCVQTARQTSSPAQHGRKAAELLYDGHSVPAAQQRQGFSPSLAIAAVIVVPSLSLSSLFSSALAFFFRQQKQHCYIFFFSLYALLLPHDDDVALYIMYIVELIQPVRQLRLRGRAEYISTQT
jgi:hypothetical protein